MKNYACTVCGHIWYEPLQKTRRPGWGCPNGCITKGLEINRDSLKIFEEILGEIFQDKSEAERTVFLDELQRFISKKRR